MDIEDKGLWVNVEKTAGTPSHCADKRWVRSDVEMFEGLKIRNIQGVQIGDEFGGSRGQIWPIPRKKKKKTGSATSDLYPSSKSLLEPVNWCSLCRNLLDSKDCNYWKRIEPDLTLADGREKYRVRTTQGWYQCGVTGLRWESCCGAELEYCLEDWDQFSQFLEKKHFTPCGPLIKIRVISGDLTSVHLPHVLCSVWNYRKDVKLLHSEESGVSLEECLLLSFHVIPICKTFPAQGVVVSSRFNVKAHCDVVIYCTSAAHLTLHVYLVPCHPYMKESVEKREKDSVKILWKGPGFPLQMGSHYTLRTSCPSHITPQKLKLTYANKTQNGFKVFVKDAKEDFRLFLFTEAGISVWDTKIQSALVPIHPESSASDSILQALTEFTDVHEEEINIMDDEIQTAQKQFAKFAGTLLNFALGGMSLSASTEAPAVHSSQRTSGSFCELCSTLQDTTDWNIVDPEVGENLQYRVSSAAGRYECSASGLRWVCDGDVSLKYHFSDWELYREDLRRMQFEPCGPLMDITVISGVLTEVHLPHVACLGSSSDSLKDEVRVLDVQDGGMFLEKCELTRFHAKLLHPTFSPKGLLIRSGFPVKVHCEVLIYQTLTAHLTLHVYLVTCDPKTLQEVDRQEKDAVKISKPAPRKSLQAWSWYTLQTKKGNEDFYSKINPESLKLRHSPIKYCEIYVKKAEDDFELHLMNNKKEEVWAAEIRAEEYRTPDRYSSSDKQKAPSMDYAVWFVDEHRAELIQRVSLVTPIADDLKAYIGDEKYSIITACKTPQEQMRKLYRFLSDVGSLEKIFYQSLLKNEPHLVADLTGEG
ncbi:uncharacterized protein LOC111196809 isoform X3 [Astyanax mexicanus]|uniref:uncharacterized protein LOC111196809 isoform X3 n=1 Tax=Astyanax mexicanus TaxID=7994 RepID=UPI0020CB531C|nr:uncharacterized protein LOC111196809 isoform X3 [Astyanax mexicanus]